MENFVNAEYVLLGMLGVILYLIYFIYSKDALWGKNIHSVTSGIEDINREMYHLKKNIAKIQESIDKNQRAMSDKEIYEEIQRNVEDTVQPLCLDFKQLQDNIMAIDSRISWVENGVKQLSIPTSVNGNDDEKILLLYKQGISLQSISKELNISQPEVEFVLKINKLQ